MVRKASFKTVGKLVLATVRMKRMITAKQLLLGQLPKTITKKIRRRRRSVIMSLDSAELDLCEAHEMEEFVKTPAKRHRNRRGSFLHRILSSADNVDHTSQGIDASTKKKPAPSSAPASVPAAASTASKLFGSAPKPLSSAGAVSEANAPKSVAAEAAAALSAAAAVAKKEEEEEEEEVLDGWRLQTAIGSAIGQIFVGGCIAVMALETMLKSDRGCGPMVQLAQTAFVAFDSGRSQLEHDTSKDKKPSLSTLRVRERTIPFYWHIGFVSICFTMSTLSNLSHNYGVTVPFHVVVKSSGLVVNMLVGAVLLGKRYNKRQIAAVLLILVGVLTVTLSKADDGKKKGEPGTETGAEVKKDSGDDSGGGGGGGSMYIGITMLVVSLFLSSLLGVLQEYSYGLFGKNWQESMFYSHFLSLPLFVSFAPKICSTAARWGIYSPQWLILLLNVVMVYVGVRGIYALTPLTSSLTTTLTMTVRKFTSLLISVFYFSNPFTRNHWGGSVMVFFGTIFYVLASRAGPAPPAAAPKKKVD